MLIYVIETALSASTGADAERARGAGMRSICAYFSVPHLLL